MLRTYDLLTVPLGHKRAGVNALLCVFMACVVVCALGCLCVGRLLSACGDPMPLCPWVRRALRESCLHSRLRGD